jgi:predicted phosphodiesterase
LSLKVPVQFVLGNGDREVLARMSGMETEWYRTAPEQWKEPVCWTAEQLREDHKQLLAVWPPTVGIEICGWGEVLFCHGTPRSDTEVFTRLTPEGPLVPVFAGLNADLVVCGHTHMQFDRMIGGVRIVNAGSVGMPFGEPGAYWLLLSSEIQLRRTAYNLSEAADLIRATNYPQARDFGERSILRPPSEEAMLQAFARIS